MEHLYVYYRALRNYLALTSENRECAAYRRAFATSDTENDSIIITRNICTVEEAPPNWGRKVSSTCLRALWRSV